MPRWARNPLHGGSSAGDRQSIPESPMPDPLSPDLLQKRHAYWRAANYLSIGQIYLQDNPLLDSPLRLEHLYVP
jgi:phosphoketolase